MNLEAFFSAIQTEGPGQMNQRPCTRLTDKPHRARTSLLFCEVRLTRHRKGLLKADTDEA